jgi:hypothetical protein
MATIDEILRRTAYQRPHMKNYKPMFGGGSDAPGRFGGSNFASSTLGYSDTPSGQGFNTPQKFYSAFTPGIAYDSFEEALAVGKESRDKQDINDYQMYSNALGVQASPEGFDAYRQEKGAERQMEQGQSQKNAALARQIFEKERALQINRRDKMVSERNALQQQAALENYRRASVQQRREAANQKARTAARSRSATSQDSRIKQLIGNARKGYYSEMNRDQFANMVKSAGVQNPLDITEAVGGFDAFSKETQEGVANENQKLRDDQIKAAEGIIKSNPAALYTYSKDPTNTSELTMQDKYRLNELQRAKNLRLEDSQRDYEYVLKEYPERLEAAKDAAMNEDGSLPDGWLDDALKDDTEGTLGELISNKVYSDYIAGDYNDPDFLKPRGMPSQFLFPTYGVSDGKFTGVIDEKTGKASPLEPGDFSESPWYYYGDQPQQSEPAVEPAVGPTGEPVPTGGPMVGQVPSPMTPNPDVPPSFPATGGVGVQSDDDRMITEVRERLAQGETPEEIMGQPPTLSGMESINNPEGNFLSRAGSTVSGTNLNQGSQAWSNLGAAGASIAKLPVLAFNDMANAWSGSGMDTSSKNVPMLDPKEWGKYGSNKIPVTKKYAIEVLLPKYRELVSKQSRGMQQGDMLEAGALKMMRDQYLIIEKLQ